MKSNTRLRLCLFFTKPDNKLHVPRNSFLNPGTHLSDILFLRPGIIFWKKGTKLTPYYSSFWPIWGSWRQDTSDLVESC